MTDRDLYPRKFNLYNSRGGHFNVVIKPAWEPDIPRGPDHPQSWGTTPQWKASIVINGVPVEHADLRDAVRGSDVLQINPTPSNEPERPQDGKLIDAQIARQVLDCFTQVMDELYNVWLGERGASDVVDSLLDD